MRYSCYSSLSIPTAIRLRISLTMPFFHSRLLGLTGDAAQIRDAARLYRVFYAKVAIEGAAEYTVDHSGFIYLMDRDGKYLGFFPPGTPSDRMVAVIKAHLSAKR
jgi:cytochrome oxidase Cu insertion factor (SCO1/SenC/PrrC family)